MSEHAHPPSSPNTLSLWKKLLFSALLSSVAFLLLLGLLEGGLRLANNGASPSLFRKVTAPDGSVIVRDNRQCTEAWFGRALARKPLPFRLEAHKPAGSFRVFVLGSSAAMGDPDPSFSLARVLELMLRKSHPNARIEVVNAAITAINSHLVRGFAEDCASLEPDVFIVYEGNNEVIGPFGPAGVFTAFQDSPTAIALATRLKRLRTGQLLSSLLHSRNAEATPSKALPSEWGGMSMFLRQQIAASDPRLASVHRHLADNLTAIARSAHGAGAATLLCTVAVNQRDFAPFLSLHAPTLSPEDLARWDALFAEGKSALASGDKAAATLAWNKALALDPTHAELNFRLGRLALEQGRDAEAARLLAAACELDALRFRTTPALNETIRSVSAPRLRLVDVSATLATKSAHGIIGDEFLYEHVHLNLRGTYETACALMPALLDELSKRGLPKSEGTPPPLLSFDELRQGLCYTTHEQAMIQISLLARYQAAPFTGQADNAYRIAQTKRRIALANERLAQPEALPALQALTRQALDASPNDWLLARNVGAMLLARGRPAEALPLLQRAHAFIDDDIDTLVPLGLCLRALGRAAEADQVFSVARRLEPRYPGLPEPDR